MSGRAFENSSLEKSFSEYTNMNNNLKNKHKFNYQRMSGQLKLPS